MTLVESLTLFGLIAGPIVGAAIAVLAESARRTHERRSTVVQNLVLSRFTPADPMFLMSINMIPIAFAGNEKILDAWDEYIQASSVVVPDAAGETVQRSVHEKTNDRLSNLLKALLVGLGYSDRHAGQVVRAGYVSTGFANHLDRQVKALDSLPRLASAAEQSANASTTLVNVAVHNLEQQRKSAPDGAT